MDWKLFLSVFTMIFIAEMGDKTQLTAMVQAGSQQARWVVFAAASSALVLSTLLAVLIGGLINRWVPTWTIHALASLVFLVFGGLKLAEAIQSWRTTVAPPVAAPASGLPTSGLYRFVLDAALVFEQAAHRDYLALAAKVTDPRLKRLFAEIAADEQDHALRLGTGAKDHAGQLDQGHGAAALPASEALAHDVAQGDRDLLAHALEHEQATATFYAELARTSLLPGLRDLFAHLAAREQAHVQALQDAGRLT